jgi:hypothetical protein
MLKYVLLATSMCIAAPAFAQETTTNDTSMQDSNPVAETAAPEQQPATPAPETQAVPAQDPAPASETATAQPVTAQPAAPAQPAQAAAAPAPAQTPATTQDQIAQVVNSEFGTYDKNGDGVLDEAEFGAWMVTLRKAAQPEFVAESAEGKAWVTAAFRQADKDNSKSVNATELTGFLTPKPAA